MTTATAAAAPARTDARVGFGDGAQVGDVGVGDVAGRDVVNGAAPEQLLGVIADAFGDERQYRRLEASAREKRDEKLDDRLDRMATILGRATNALVVQAVVLSLLLLVMIQVLVLLVSPRLVAGV